LKNSTSQSSSFDITWRLLTLLKCYDGKISLGRPRREWENNIKMDLQVVGWGGMDRIAVPQDTGR